MDENADQPTEPAPSAAVSAADGSLSACTKTEAAGSTPTSERIGSFMMILDRIALIVSIIGALNWGSIGLFQFDLVSWICGGAATVAARIIYTVVALAGIWCISLLFRSRDYDALEDS